LAQIPLRRRELLILDTSKIWKFLELMPRLTDSVTHAGLADRVFGENELRDVLGGRDARRYGLVNRALKDGSLRRLKRGVYVLNSRYRKEPLHPFAVAQSLHPGSYVSFETALSYHGWIPEAVFTTASVTPGRKTLSFDTPDHGFYLPSAGSPGIPASDQRRADQAGCLDLPDRQAAAGTPRPCRLAQGGVERHRMDDQRHAH
jgi:hypothetical protein